MSLGKTFSSALFVTVLGLVLVSPVSAKQVNSCFCHNVNNDPVTVCSDEQSQINGHSNHVNNGTDTQGACPIAPSVPEFGMIPGIMAVVGSAGSYALMKKRII